MGELGVDAQDRYRQQRRYLEPPREPGLPVNDEIDRVYDLILNQTDLRPYEHCPAGVDYSSATGGRQR